MYKYTCDLCGIEIDGEGKEGVVEAAQHHLQTDHNLQKEAADVTEPNLGYERDEIEERIEEVD